MSLIPPESLDDLVYYASHSPPGAIVEVGVYKGGSALRLAELNRPLYLYDTFTGIPCAGPYDLGHKIGDFADTSFEAVKALIPSAHVIKGVFPLSLVAMPPVAFVHCDVDQYESTLAVCNTMPAMMVRGGIILFDDYGTPGCPGATQAVEECFDRILILNWSKKALVII